jgi:diguanylate cyclase (GGDEF)-like protein
MAEEEKTSVHTIEDLVQARKNQSAYLIVISAKSPAGVGKMFKLDKSELIIGRAADCSLQVEDDGVSRHHAKLVRAQDKGFQLVDLESTNGTYLNGERVTQHAVLDGDKIQVGANTVLKFSLQDQLEEQFQRSIYESATRDGLTGAYNKKYFLDTLRKEFSYCVRHKLPLSVVMFDVDLFKKVNDTYGHPAGDHVLARIGARVQESVRNEDLFARYGGEEFALMLREIGEREAIVCAERCRRAVEQEDFIFNGVQAKVTISLGVATLRNAEFKDPEEFLAMADTYLYRAKQAGRNRVVGLDVSGPAPK